MYTGSCLCGAIKYEIVGEIRQVSHCHCSMCRKAHGAAFATYGTLLHKDIQYTQGAQSIERYQSSPTVTRTFCRRCASNLEWFSSVDHPEWTSIALGTLDTPFVPTRQTHIYVSSKAPWYEIKDDHPQKSAGTGS